MVNDDDQSSKKKGSITSQSYMPCMSVCLLSIQACVLFIRQAIMPFRRLRKKGIRKRSSFPSPWVMLKRLSYQILSMHAWWFKHSLASSCHASALYIKSPSHSVKHTFRKNKVVTQKVGIGSKSNNLCPNTAMERKETPYLHTLKSWFLSASLDISL